MLSDDQLRDIQPRLMINLIVAGAIFMGGVLFAAVIAITADWNVVGQPSKMLNTLGAGTAIVMYGLAFAIPRTFPRVPDSVAPQQGEATFLVGLQQIASLMTTETIVRYALIEGGVFLNITVFMLEPRWVTAVVIGLGLLVMLVSLPLPGRAVNQFQQRVEQWQRGIR